ncbi:DUF6346 domain-containing protein [Dactylosporangium siamense]|uniref:Uncharacterized protein n=1 Tax=Dactylosporangium siamense TaxID=685454 RepID=A0A919PUF2_9ACTN|nr:DUF6346 domain-containing protein [Dactylosporangium siamense]GIG48603.1 hypothetical protein Dsi01nite_066440 [Dactylosporangium siamense]
MTYHDDKVDVHATVDRSVVTGKDVGRKVTIRERCDDSGCSYGRSNTSRWLGGLGGLVFLAGMAVFMPAFCYCVRYLFRAVFGTSRD